MNSSRHSSAHAAPAFIVLTGFLGSGKTTLLRDFLDLPEAADTAIIVNEAGEIGLDGAVLADGGGDVRLSMLANGCVCCQGASDLAVAVEALLRVDRPEAQGPLRRIILETSGLSKPGPVLRSLGVLAEHRMPVSIVSTYDAARGRQLAAFPEALAQWAGAQALIVTKTDLLGPQARGQAGREAGAVNPLARVISGTQRGKALWDAIAAAGPRDAGFDPPETGSAEAGAHPRIGVFLVKMAGEPAYEALAAWLDNLAGLLGDRLLRLKGLVRTGESDVPLLVQSVGTLFSMPRPFRAAKLDRGSFIVVIARDTTLGDLRGVTPDLGMVVTTTAAGAFGGRKLGVGSRPGMAERVTAP
ncbi:cobalamin biosynthesis protein CobW [Phreatobacter stygius]|uniref:Cobalamin biosynthesis protein CobW n=2 Tax=Phreatobacter stygius TaxID=1940610 RepID=A0A4D7B599_9HYPH|nr:cobalamin biosynthesis protein CobW [Phreatobacter stygius]